MIKSNFNSLSNSKFWCVSLVVHFFVLLNASRSEELNDFVGYVYYENGELETLIKHGGVSAKEITVADKNQSGLSLRQISNGKRFLQLIYDEESLKECNYIERKDQIEKFLDSFNPTNFYNLTTSTSKVIVDNLRDRNLPPDVKSWFNFKRMKKLCHQKLKEIKRGLKQFEKRRLEEIEEEKLYGRARRDVSNLFRVPGTQWCGKGYSAKKYTDVGMFWKTDRCCRQHDTACPHWIGGFQMKYGVQNNMINTLMHCSCDERFRACLKRVGTIDANLVGNIFFNFVQRECFTLKRKKICDKKYQNDPKRSNSKFRMKKNLKNSKRNSNNNSKMNLQNNLKKNAQNNSKNNSPNKSQNNSQNNSKEDFKEDLKEYIKGNFTEDFQNNLNTTNREDLKRKRSKRNDKKCRRKNSTPKAIIRRNLVY